MKVLICSCTYVSPHVDLPIIVSGKYVGILDPHRHHIMEIDNPGSVHSGKLFTLSEFIQHQGHASLFQGVFDFDANAESYKGTLFRFPFRTSQSNSELSKTEYTEEKVINNLYKSFEKEAPHMLLFLKNVSSIELHIFQNSQMKLLSSVTAQCNESSSGWAASKCHQIQEAKDNAVKYGCMTNFFTKMVKVEGENTGEKSYNWLVSHTIGTDDSSLMETAFEHKVAPWVGLAVQVPNDLHIEHCTFENEYCLIKNCTVSAATVCQSLKKRLNASCQTVCENILSGNKTESFAFCFLPLPEVTGLPINVHGYFSIGSDRRRFKWPSHDVKGEDAKWNQKLVYSLLIPSYAVFLVAKTIIWQSVRSWTPSLAYSWWPDPSLLPLRGTWQRSFLDDCGSSSSLPSLIIKMPLFWTELNGGDWITVDNAVFIKPDRCMPHSVQQLLLNLGLPLAEVPQQVLDCISCLPSVKLKYADPLVVCSQLKLHVEKTSYCLSDTTLLVDLLAFLIPNLDPNENNLNYLVDIPIVPLKLGSPACLHRKSFQGSEEAPEFYVYHSICTAKDDLLPGMENKLISAENPILHEFFQKLASCCSNNISLAMATPEVISRILMKESIETWAVKSGSSLTEWDPHDSKQPHPGWLSNLWKWIVKNEVESPTKEVVIHEMSSLPIIPLNSSQLNTGEKMILTSLDDNKTLLHHCKDTVVCHCPIKTVQRLGCRIVEISEEFLPILEKLHQYIPILNPMKLACVLSKVPSILKLVSELPNDEKEVLQTFFTSALEKGEQITFIRALPIFKVKSENSYSLVSLSSHTNVVFPEPNESIKDWPVLQASLLILCYERRQEEAYKCILGCNPSSTPSIIINNILTAMESPTPQVTSWVLQNLSGDNVMRLRDLPFLQSRNGNFQCASDLYDPEDEILSMFFSNDTSVFPMCELKPHYPKLRNLGLKTWYHICSCQEDFLIFVKDRIASLVTLEGKMLLERSKLILKEIYKSDYQKLIWKNVNESQFLLCDESCPSGYIANLNWAGAKKPSQLLAPIEVCLIESAHLIGSVKLVLLSEYHDLANLDSKDFYQISPRDICSHLQNMMSLPNTILQDHKMDITAAIIKAYDLLCKSSPSVNIELDKVWNPDSGHFESVKELALNPIPGVSLVPYRMSISEMKMNMIAYRALWENIGIRDNFDENDCLAVLHLLQQSPLQKATTEMVATILKHLKNISYIFEDILIPTTEGIWSKPNECYFDNCKLTSKDPELRSNFSIVHPLIHKNGLTDYLGIVPLSYKVASPQPLVLTSESAIPPVSRASHSYSLTECLMELLKFADGVGATKAALLVDWHHHLAESLFTEKLKIFQGPGLYMCIDKGITTAQLKSEFSDLLSMENVPFSQGFPAVFGLSDVPSILILTSSEYVIFDLNSSYLCHLTPEPFQAISFDVARSSEDLNKFYGDQFQPLREVNLATKQKYKSIIRIPFSTIIGQQLSSPTCTEIEKAINSLKSVSDTLLLFFKNLSKLKVSVKQEEEVSFQKCLIIRRVPWQARPVTFSGATKTWKICASMDSEEMKEACWVTTSFTSDVAMSEGLTVKAQVSVPLSVDHPKFQIGDVTTKKGCLFSCVPLQIHLPTKCHIDLTYELKGKVLTIQTSKAKAIEFLTGCGNGDVETVCKSLFQLLKEVQSVIALPPEVYYDLWPTHMDPTLSAVSFSNRLKGTFLQHLSTYKDTPLVYSRQKEWISLQDCCILEDIFYGKDFKQYLTLALEIATQQVNGLTDFPKPVLLYLNQSSTTLVKEITFEHYFTNIFYHEWKERNLKQSSDLVSQHRHIVQHYNYMSCDSNTIKKHLYSTPSIPTEPDWKLKCPNQLIDPDSTDALLYNESDECFPVKEYCDIRHVLKDLGMKSRLEKDNFIERAQSVQHLSFKMAQERAEKLVSILSQSKIVSESLLASLSTIPFLPTKNKPSSPNIPWFKDHQFFSAPSDLYSSKYFSLVYTQSSVIGLDGSLEGIVEKYFKMKGYPTLDVILHHLKTIIDWVKTKSSSEERFQLNESDYRLLSQSAEDVYSYLSELNGNEVVQRVKCQVGEKPFLWHKEMRCFLPTAQVVLSIPTDIGSLSPFMYSSNELEYLKRNRSLWTSLGVRESCRIEDLVGVLQKVMEDESVDLPIQMVVSILRYMKREGHKEGAVLPTVKGKLVNPKETVFDDRNWSERRRNLRYRFEFVHSDVSAELAIFFGAVPLSRKLASAKKLPGMFQQRGQSEDLTTRLRNILGDYKDDVDVIKELVQNADDAEASEVKFLLDWRRHPEEDLFTDEMKRWQGPALCAYNNSEFSDKDFENICALGGATKREKANKIGRFGLGFCSTYHLTDVPSFVSRTQLTIFDPCLLYLREVMENFDTPGICVDFVESKENLQECPNQLAPYQGVFGCNLSNGDGFKGTLFRFPFRQKVGGKISKEVFDIDKVEKMKDNFCRLVDTLLVFLSHVRSVEFYELKQDQPLREIKRLFSVSKFIERPIMDSLLSSYTLGDIASTKSQLSKFTIEKHVQGEEVDSVTWCTSSVLVTGRCMNKAEDVLMRRNGFAPFAEVAVPVRVEGSLLVPVPYSNSHLCCFLPLPISTDLKFLVNGIFDISKDRRSLTDLQDRSKPNSWNRVLIEDAVKEAIVTLLKEFVKRFVGCGSDRAKHMARLVEDFYKIWPNADCHDDVSTALKDAFSGTLLTCKLPFFFTKAGVWKSFPEIHILHSSLKEEVFERILPSWIEVIIQSGKYHLADPPATICRCLPDIPSITFEDYIKSCLSPLFSKLRKSMQEDNIRFILQQFEKLYIDYPGLCCDLKKLCCIPSRPNGNLVHPARLISPSDLYFRLFDEEEERFPSEEYFNSFPKALLSLGMADQTISPEDIKEKALNLPSIASDRALERFDAIIEYLDKTHQRQPELIHSLCEVPFIPVEPKPSNLNLDWKMSNTGYAKPSEVYLPDKQTLIFSQCMILSKITNERCKTVFKFNTNPSLNTVLSHLNALLTSEERFQLNESDYRLLSQSAEDVYSYLSELNGNEVVQRVKHQVCEKPFLWHKEMRCFLPTAQVVLSIPTDIGSLSPFLYSSNELEYLKRNRSLWTSLGVRESCRMEDLVGVLQKMMKDECVGLPIQMVVNILRYMKREGHKEGAVLPTVKGKLVNPKETVFDDRNWSERRRNLRDRFEFVHSDVSPELAIFFGAVPLSRKLASAKKLPGMFQQRGQSEDLTTRLRNILGDYKDDVDVIKELVQNADDAEASEVKFLLDWRRHPEEDLFTDEMKRWQGPALCAYNNSVFSDKDFENICALGGATKREKANKIGRFGLGFCSTYHLTDVPSFVSRTQLTIFDPCLLYLREVMENFDTPGICVDFVESKENLQECPNQLAPYQGVFGCNLSSGDGFEGTLFRFPFRQAVGGKISKEVFDIDKVEKMKDNFCKLVDTLSVFLSHVRSVEFYELKQDQPLGEMKRLFSVSKFIERPMMESLLSSYTLGDIASTKSQLSECTIEKHVQGEEVDSVTWYTSSVLVTGRCMDKAEEVLMRGNGFAPFAEVAVPVRVEGSLLVPVPYSNSHLCCFLPLPISTDLKFLVNGIFDISKDRRSLTDLQDRSKPNSWNRVLIEDAVKEAIVALLKEFVKRFVGCGSDRAKHMARLVEDFYKIWPNADCHDDVSTALKDAFSGTLLTCKLPFFFTKAGAWKSFPEIHILHSSLKEEVFELILPSWIEVIIQSGKYHLADPPATICRCLPDIPSITFEDYFKSCLSPLFSKLRKSMQEDNIQFILQQFEKLHIDYPGLCCDLKKLCCIPSRPNGNLVHPARLISPSDLHFRLFDEKEERFPSEEYFNSFPKALLSLGMADQTISLKDIKEKALNLPSIASDRALERFDAIIEYLDKTHQRQPELIHSLCEVPFIPVEPKPSNLNLDWKMSNTGYAKPSEVYLPDKQTLIFSQCMILSKRTNERCKTVFKFTTNPPLNTVLSHLNALLTSKERFQLNESDYRLLSQSAEDVYSYLSELNGNEVVQRVKCQIGEKPFLWHKEMGCFLPTAQVVLSIPTDIGSLSPFMYSSNELEYLKRNRSLWTSLGIRESCRIEDLVSVLQEVMGEESVDLPIQMVVSILRYMKREGHKDGAVLPTVNGKLVNPKETVLDDRNWSERRRNLRDRFEFVHSEVSAGLAIFFGAVPLSRKLASAKKLPGMFQQRGQSEDLTTRLRNILGDYKDDVDVIKELVQNADDAEASEVKFLLDWRRHPEEDLFTDEMKRWQGPALCAYNNSVFSDKDFENICALGGATKREKANKIGRFGLGFCSTYHLTDVPSFVSRTQLTIFDPCLLYLREVMENFDTPGICVDFVESKENLQECPNQLAPYQGVFGCNLSSGDGFEGTLFRFPFRQAVGGKISKEVFDIDKVEKMKDNFCKLVDTLLVFLSHVRSVEFYELKQDQPLGEMKRLFSVSKFIERPMMESLLSSYTLGDIASTKSQLSECTIEKHVQGEEVDSVTWCTSSVLVTGRCMDKAEKVLMRGNGFAPFAEVAVPVRVEGSLLVPVPYSNSHLCCFLPLPISTDLKFLVNGIFDISKDRRSLTDLQDRSKPNSWNRVLIEDAVTVAVFKLLEYFKYESPNQHFLKCFYALWPVNQCRAFSDVLQKAFIVCLCTDTNSLVFAEDQHWRSISEICILSMDFSSPAFKDILQDCIKLLKECRKYIAQLPKNVIRLLNSLDLKCVIQEMTVEKYCQDCLFPKIDEPYVDIAYIINQMKILLENYIHFESNQWLHKLLTSNDCIPILPENKLVNPKRLIDPKCKLASLYSEQDGRFPCKQLQKESILLTLREMGMTYEFLEGEDLLERAKSVQKLEENGLHNDALDRSKYLVEYLISDTIVVVSSSFPVQLSQIPFLPLERRCESGIYPNTRSAFMCASKLYPNRHFNLVFSHSNVLSSSVPSECEDILDLKPDPSLEDVLQHLKKLIAWISDIQPTEEDKVLVTESIAEIYSYFNKELGCPNGSEIANKLLLHLKGEAFIWDQMNGTFITSQKVALKHPEMVICSLSPFRRTRLDLECLTKYNDLWRALKVKDQLDFVDCEAVLNEMKEKNRFDIEVILKILKYLKTGPRVVRENVLFPLREGKLEMACKCVYDDQQWIKRSKHLPERFKFVHDDVPAFLAKAFHIPPVSSKIASPKGLKVKSKEYGQREPLTRRLHNIVTDYKDDIDVFKELIQNADDAGATEVKFLIDWRTHPKEYLFTKEMKHWQGPALCAYNNSVFSDEDFENLCELGGATKSKETDKIGQFGLGFCAVYNMTDVPSLVSRDRLVTFDPHLYFLKGVTELPGISINFVEELIDMKECYKGQLAPFENIFGCNMLSNMDPEGYRGTLFRFPFRSKAMSDNSLISKAMYDTAKVAELKANFVSQADVLLIFLRHVQKIELYEINSKQKVSKPTLLLSVQKKGVLCNGVVTPNAKETAHTKTFTIQVQTHSNQPTIEKQWLVSSYCSVDRMKKSNDIYMHNSMHCAEVAIPIIQREFTCIPCPLTKGQIFCYLPLPITIENGFLVNGHFKVSKDRRSLTEIDEDTNFLSWNRVLIMELLTDALLVLLVYLGKENGNIDDYFLRKFYNIWPFSVESTHPLSKILKDSFKTQMALSEKQLSWSQLNGGQWSPFKDIVVLDTPFNDDIFKNIRPSIRNVLVQQNYNVADLPKMIQHHALSQISVHKYYINVLLPQLANFSNQLVQEQIYFVLKHLHHLKYLMESSTDLLEEMKTTQCIPCEPNGKLQYPSKLISSHKDSPLCKLFSLGEERFPIQTFLAKKQLRESLHTIGMPERYMSNKDVISRARKVVYEENAVIFCELLTEYIDRHLSHNISTAEELMKHLSDIPFLPVLKKKTGCTLPWFEGMSFCSPSKIYHPDCKSLVFSLAPVLDKSITRSFSHFVFLTSPSLDDVLKHLSIIVHYCTEKVLTSEDIALLNECMVSIYSFINEKMTSEESCEQISHVLSCTLPFIWQGNHFLKPAQMMSLSVKGIRDCYPYMIKLCKKYSQFSDLFILTGMPCSVTSERASKVMKDIYNDFNGKSTNDEIVTFLRDLVSIICKECNSDHEYYLPDEKNIIRNCKNLISKEDIINKFHKNLAKILQRLDTTFILHPSISKNEAKYIGVRDLLEVILDDVVDASFAEEDEFEQHEPLVIRLNNLLKQYKADVTIFKEFIQNADDAEATEIAFILDHSCNYPDQSLSENSPDWKLLQKVPSLLVVNNRKFEEEDFKGISQLGLGTKREDADKIGRFGIGFNVAYHVTDCPQFVSYGKDGVPEDFCVFDPNESFLTKNLFATQQKRGRRLKLQKMKDGRNATECFSDQFKPFLSSLLKDATKILPGCLEEATHAKPWPKGYVVFRLPLTRCPPNSIKTTLIEGECMTIQKLQMLSLRLHEHAHSLLLFLKNIKRLSYLEINSKGKIRKELSWSMTTIYQDSNNVDFDQSVSVVHANMKLKGMFKDLPCCDCTSEVVMYAEPAVKKRTKYPASHHFVPPSWTVSKLFGGSELIDWRVTQEEYERNKVLPIIAVATANNCTSVEGCLSSSLPLPVKLDFPLFINGDFILDTSRRFIDIQSNWNLSLVKNILPLALKNLILHCRCKVDGHSDSIKWFYSLLLCSLPGTDLGPQILKDLPYEYFNILLTNEMEILLSDRGRGKESRVSWLALTQSSHHEGKG